MTNLSNRSIFILFAVVLCLVSACKKNKSTTPVTPKGILYFNIHSNVDTVEISSADTAIDAGGRRFKLAVAEFYMSGITLRKADGSTVVLNGKYILKDLGSTEYYADSVVAGNYVSVSFNVGIDAATNLTNPSSYPSSHPLADQSPNMWFGTPSQGYIFMLLQGLADTTASQTGRINAAFNYKTGTSNMLRNVTLDKAFTVVANQPVQVHFAVDYGKVLEGINFKTNSEGSPWLNPDIATHIANNVSLMIAK